MTDWLSQSHTHSLTHSLTNSVTYSLSTKWKDPSTLHLIHSDGIDRITMTASSFTLRTAKMLRYSTLLHSITLSFSYSTWTFVVLILLTIYRHRIITRHYRRFVLFFIYPHIWDYKRYVSAMTKVASQIDLVYAFDRSWRRCFISFPTCLPACPW